MIVNRFVPSSEIFSAINTNKNTEQVAQSNSFGQTLKSKLDDENDKIIDSNTLTNKMISGDENVSINDVILSTEEAKMSLQLAVQVRNKLVEAYQEISKIQL